MGLIIGIIIIIVVIGLISGLIIFAYSSESESIPGRCIGIGGNSCSISKDGDCPKNYTCLNNVDSEDIGLCELLCDCEEKESDDTCTYNNDCDDPNFPRCNTWKGVCVNIDCDDTKCPGDYKCGYGSRLAKNKGENTQGTCSQKNPMRDCTFPGGECPMFEKCFMKP